MVDHPLFSGQYFNSPIKKSIDGNKVYSQIDGKYKVTNRATEYEYDKKFTTIFPRMYSSQKKHLSHYKNWSGFNGTNGFPIKTSDNKTIYKPTFSQNLKFFFNYQIGWMYVRYFMWNFAGRQNDIQGHGNIFNGNWITGINFIDELRLGQQNNLPDIYKNNGARNKYYMLPLLLGILGMIFLYKKNYKDFIVVLLLFILTGLAIVVYLNQPPVQPRERDYAYVGSFYAFAIFIGLGVLGVYEYLQKILKNNNINAGLSTILCLLLVPTIMAKENYDDHDRSKLTTARDFAKNYLQSCAPNAILFTNGDNDTFPLWYVQEVENFRTDVRVCNLSLLQTDWYIDQMKRKAYDSDPLPITMNKNQYIQGTRDVVPIVERYEKPLNLKTVINFIKSDNKGSKVRTSGGDELDFFPTRQLFLKVNKKNVFANNSNKYKGENSKSQIKLKDSSIYLDQLDFKLTGNYIGKNHLAVLDLLQGNDWKRPVYYANSMGSENHLGLSKYFQNDGLTYRIVPFVNKSSGQFQGGVDVEILYDNVMNKFAWGGLDNNNDIFINENNARMIKNIQSVLVRLAKELIKKANETNDSTYFNKAENALDKIVQISPNSRLSYTYMNLFVGEEYYNAQCFEKGDKEVNILASCCENRLKYYNSLPTKFKKQAESEIRQNVSILYNLLRTANKHKRTEIVNKYSKSIKQYLQ